MEKLRELIELWDYHVRQGDAEALTELRRDILKLARKHRIRNPWEAV